MKKRTAASKPILKHWARMDGLNLKGKAFQKADLSWSTFRAADLTDADFTKAMLTRCSFRNAILRNTNFAGCDLTFADFGGAIIDNVNFCGANLMWAHLCDTDMLRANLRGAFLEWSCLNNAQLSPEQIKALPKGVFTHHQHLEAIYKSKYASSGRYGTEFGYNPFVKSYALGYAKEDYESKRNAQKRGYL